MKKDVEKMIKKLESYSASELEEMFELAQAQHEITFNIEDDTFGESENEVSAGTGDENVFEMSDMPSLERVVDRPNFLPVYFLEEGQIKQKSVARVLFPSGGGATGFLISPTILMTNNHVFGSKASARTAKIQFNYQIDASGSTASIDEYTTDPDNLFYTNASLDFTIVRINKKCIPSLHLPMQPSSEADYADYQAECDCCGSEFTPNPFGPIVPPELPPIRLPGRPPILRPPFRPPFRPPLQRCFSPGSRWGHISLPRTAAYSLNQLVNIIQHPRLRRKEVSLQENEIKNIFTTRIRYRTDTDRGSSGSPVFNNTWDLIALHHAAGEHRDGEWVSNQGIRIDRIVQDLRSNFNSSNTGRRVLVELGIA